MNEKLDKYKSLLWCDLKTDLERAEFIECGRAWETGIIAKIMEGELAAVFRFRHEALK